MKLIILIATIAVGTVLWNVLEAAGPVFCAGALVGYFFNFVERRILTGQWD